MSDVFVIVTVPFDGSRALELVQLAAAEIREIAEGQDLEETERAELSALAGAVERSADRVSRLGLDRAVSGLVGLVGALEVLFGPAGGSPVVSTLDRPH